MTKEEAIKYLQYIGMSFVPTDQYGDYDDPRPYEEALDMAIEALSADTTKGDLISRQWLLELYGDYIGDNGDPKYHVPLEVVRQNIKDAPSAVCDDCIWTVCNYNKVDWDTPSADAEPTVIRSKTLMPTKDFKEWANRVREENTNVIVIPCDAEVVDVNKAHEEEHLTITNKIKELQYAIAKTQTVVGKMVESAETAQGEWVRHELWGNPWFTCSECNYHGRNDFNYCPNCGADNRGEEE